MFTLLPSSSRDEYFLNKPLFMKIIIFAPLGACQSIFCLIYVHLSMYNEQGYEGLSLPNACAFIESDAVQIRPPVLQKRQLLPYLLQFA